MTVHATIFQEWFGIRPVQARIVAELYAANGEFVPASRLTEVSGQTKEQLSYPIKLLRSAMDAYSVEGDPGGSGWRLTDVGRRDCERGLADAAARGVAA